MTSVQVTAELLSTKKLGDFHHLTLVAPGIAESFRPGNLVSLAVGGPLSDRLARRTFPIAKARATGAYGGTIELLLDPTEPGEQWLADADAGTKVDALGPLGRPFALPKTPVPCVLVGYAAAAAPLQPLAERLRERGCDVHMLLGAPTESRVYGVLDARRSAKSVTVTTVDGSLGIQGTLTGPMTDLLRRTGAEVVYAAADRGLLQGVSTIAEAEGAWSQLLVTVPMPCGTGLCNTCTVDVAGADGVVRQGRVCVEGPVFRGDRLCWAREADAVVERSA
jgi:dihydroorotate dehydrogenase electron transfer subunit